MKKLDDCFVHGEESRGMIQRAGFYVEKALESSGGDVFLARYMRSDNFVVVKRFRGHLDKCFEAKEMFLWQDHDHIVRILDVISVKVDTTLIVCEFVAGGDLYHHFQELGVFPEFLARILMHDLFTGVSLLHRVGICHRDLKPENCVLDANGMLKIIDFGIAARFEEGSTLFNDFCGSLEYLAPEVLLRHPYRGPNVDVWACGVVLFEMVVGEAPFLIKEGEIGCCAGIFTFPDMLVAEAELSVDCVQLLKQILVIDPEQRLRLPSAFDSTWMVTEHVLSADDVNYVKDQASNSVLVKRLQSILRRQVAQDMAETNQVMTV